MDLPSQFFELSIEKNGIHYNLSGIAWHAFIFTAVGVKDAAGTVRPLKTFYWDVKHCESLPPGTDLSKPKAGGPVNIAPFRDCATGSCDASEPGFDKINQARTTDTYTAAVKAGLDETSFDGPAKFDIGCAKS